MEIIHPPSGLWRHEGGRGSAPEPPIPDPTSGSVRWKPRAVRYLDHRTKGSLNVDLGLIYKLCRFERCSSTNRLIAKSFCQAPPYDRYRNRGHGWVRRESTPDCAVVIIRSGSDVFLGIGFPNRFRGDCKNDDAQNCCCYCRPCYRWRASHHACTGFQRRFCSRGYRVLFIAVESSASVPLDRSS